MNRAEFVGAISSKLRELGLRKPIRTPRHVFHISDDSGTTRNFVVKQTDRSEIYTRDDIENILSAIIDVVGEALVHGEKIQIRGFGTFELKWRNERKANHPVSGEVINIKGRYVPDFVFAKEFRVFGRLYELSVEDMLQRQEKERLPDDELGLEDGDD